MSFEREGSDGRQISIHSLRLLCILEMVLWSFDSFRKKTQKTNQQKRIEREEVDFFSNDYSH